MNWNQCTIIMRGAGDIASGAALRLWHAGLKRLVLLEIEKPMAVRRHVSFSEAVYKGSCTVEGVTARLIQSPDEAPAIWESGEIPLLVDPDASRIKAWRHGFQVMIEATLAKRNVGVSLHDAPLVVGVGPGFTAGHDVHCVVETLRGIRMGRLYYTGQAAPNTGSPEAVMGHTDDRVLRAPCAGMFETRLDLGDTIEAGQSAGEVNGQAVISAIGGTIRGLLRPGLSVPAGAKLGDVEPRPDVRLDLVSDKSLAVGGALLEAIGAALPGF